MLIITQQERNVKGFRKKSFFFSEKERHGRSGQKCRITGTACK